AHTAATPARAAAACEALKDDVALILGNPRSVVLDGDLDTVVDPLQRHRRRAVGVLLRIVEQVGDHSGEAPLVGLHHHRCELAVELDRHIAAAPGRLHRLHHELDQTNLVELEPYGAGVVTGDLQQV